MWHKEVEPVWGPKLRAAGMTMDPWNMHEAQDIKRYHRIPHNVVLNFLHLAAVAADDEFGILRYCLAYIIIHQLLKDSNDLRPRFLCVLFWAQLKVRCLCTDNIDYPTWFPPKDDGIQELNRKFRKFFAVGCSLHWSSRLKP